MFYMSVGMKMVNIMNWFFVQYYDNFYGRDIKKT